MESQNPCHYQHQELTTGVQSLYFTFLVFTADQIRFRKRLAVCAFSPLIPVMWLSVGLGGSIKKVNQTRIYTMPYLHTIMIALASDIFVAPVFLLSCVPYLKIYKSWVCDRFKLKLTDNVIPSVLVLAGKHLKIKR